MGHSGQGTGNTSSNTDSAAGVDFLKSIIPFFTDLFPLFLEKWAEVNDRPALKSLEKELARSNRKLESLTNQVRWLYPALAMLLIWNIFLTIFIAFIVK